MRYSEHDLCHMAASVRDPTLQGRLHYKGIQQGKLRNVRELQGPSYRERFFKLQGNLLFYYRLPEDSSKRTLEPLGALLLERCTVQREINSDRQFLLSIAFHDDRDRKHYLMAPSGKLCDQWVMVIRNASYEQLKTTLAMLQNKIRRLKDMSSTITKSQQQLKSSPELNKRPLVRSAPIRPATERTERSHTLPSQTHPQSELSPSMHSMTAKPGTLPSFEAFSQESVKLPGQCLIPMTDQQNIAVGDPWQKPSMNTGQVLPKPSANTGQALQKASMNTGQPLQKPSINTGQPLLKPSMNTRQPLLKPSMNTGQPLQKNSMNSGQSLQKLSMNTGQQLLKPSMDTGQPLLKPNMDTGQPAEGLLLDFS